MSNYRRFLYPHPTHPQYNPNCREAVKKRHLLARDYLYGDVLDAPCGCGWGASIYMKDNPKIKSVTGMDLCQEALDFGRTQYKDINFISQNILELDCERKYDCIVGFEAIEHLTKNEGLRYVNNIHRALKPNGIALFSTPDNNNLETEELSKCEVDGKTQFHITMYSEKDLRELLSIFPNIFFRDDIDKTFFVICKENINNENDTKIQSKTKTKVIIL